jgi:DNA-binding NarL/FixJ family response regulator
MGYVLKSQSSAEVLGAIRTVARGDMYFAPGLTPRRSSPPARPSEPTNPLGPLSAREREVFTLVVRGFTTGAIARELFISAKTVETHRYHINAKLGLHSSAELVRFAAANGLLDPFTKKVGSDG